jgi:hypothetical protein
MMGTFPLRLGDLGSWVGSVGTGVALIIAFWQIVILRRDRDARQASLISMWISGKSLKGNATETGLDASVEISFLNASTQPLGQVLYEVRLGSKKQWGRVGPVAPDNEVRKKTIAFSDMTVDDANAAAEMDIWFTDEAGHRWSRNQTGRLKEGVRPPSDFRTLGFKFGIPHTNKTENEGQDDSKGAPA